MEKIHQMQDKFKKLTGMPTTGAITKRELLALKKKENLANKKLMELSNRKQKKVGKTSRVLRQMDGDTLSQQISSYRRTILFHIHASLDETEDMLDYIRNKTQDTNGKDDCGRSAMHYACRSGAARAVNMLLREDGSLDEPDFVNEWTPLHFAIQGGYRRIVTLMMEKAPIPRITVNRKDKNGMTPLMLACGEGHTLIAQILIGNGAELEAVDKDGWSAIHYAAFRDQAATAELLIDFGINFRRKAKSTGETAIQMAERTNSVRVALMLFEFD